jgi:hypothetical protein
MVDANTRRKFEALVSAAFVDGFLADSEKEILRQKAEEMKIPLREMHEILGLGQQRKLSVSIPATTLEREQLLEDLIDVVGADGRVEAAEYHLLARFADSLKISLPDLRVRVNRRMQGRSEPKTKVETRKPPDRPEAARHQTQLRPPLVEPYRQQTQVRPKPAEPSRPAEPPSPPSFESPKFPQNSLPVSPPGPIRLESSMPKEPKAADLPPVTLQLLKQSIMFDNESDSILTIGRTLGLPPSKAAEVRAAILAAYPDLKPGSQQVRPRL